MSFVDLMANDVWSEADIVRRTEAMIRSEFSLEAETILNRKVLGLSLGTYTPTPADQAEIARYDQVAKDAQAAGVQARNDMALLLQVFPMEEAQRRLDQPSLAAAWARLDQPEVEPIYDENDTALNDTVLNAEDVARDEQERAAASAIVQPCTIIDETGAVVLDPDLLAADNAERAEAQAVIDGASDDAKALFALRRSPP